MAHSFIVTLGVSSVAKSDVDLRAYIDGAADTGSVASDATWAEIGSTGDYLVDNLPEVGEGSFYTLTLEYPSGVGIAHRWPDQDNAPSTAVIAVRETGLSKSDLNLKIYKNGAEDDATLTVSEFGSTGDYAVSGWPTSETGDWLLRYQRSGVSYFVSWSVPASATTTAFIDDLADCFPDTVTAQPVTVDAFGDWSANGASTDLSAYIEAENKLVRNSAGEEVTSSLQAYIAGTNSLTTDGHRYTLPARFDPNSDRQAIAIEKASDGDGEVYEAVMFS